MACGRAARATSTKRSSAAFFQRVESRLALFGDAVIQDAEQQLRGFDGIDARDRAQRRQPNWRLIVVRKIRLSGSKACAKCRRPSARLASSTTPRSGSASARSSVMNVRL